MAIIDENGYKLPRQKITFAGQLVNRTGDGIVVVAHDILDEKLNLRQDEINEGKSPYLQSLKESIEQEIKDRIQGDKNVKDEIIAGAPEAWDTLQEIAAWIAEHNIDFQTLSDLVAKNKAAINKEIQDRTDADKYIQDQTTELNKEVFPLLITVSGGKVVEVGSSNDIIISWKVNYGSKVADPDTFTALSINGQDLDKTTKSKAFNDVTNTTKYTVHVEGKGMTAEGSTTLQFVYRTYCGAVPSDWQITEDNVRALTSSALNTGRGYTLNYSVNNGKVALAYPAAYGNLTSIVDGNGYEYINAFTLTDNVQINNTTYKVYLTTDPFSIGSGKFIFK